jgi:hypothetical protein
VKFFYILQRDASLVYRGSCHAEALLSIPYPRFNRDGNPCLS